MTAPSTLALLLVVAAPMFAYAQEPAAVPESVPAEGAPPAEPVPMDLPKETAEREDSEPPLIEDVAVAASSPKTPPMITAIITDDWSGVEQAHVVYRLASDGEWKKTPLNAGTGGLFVASLPDGTQKTGFEYYIEVFDAAKNGPALVGSAEKPYRVEPSAKGTLQRMEEEREREELGPVHPAWMVLSLGTGVLAAAGSGAFWIDFANLQRQHSTETNEERRLELERAMLGDGIIGGLLGLIAFTGMATGAGLLVYSAMNE